MQLCELAQVCFVTNCTRSGTWAHGGSVEAAFGVEAGAAASVAIYFSVMGSSNFDGLGTGVRHGGPASRYKLIKTFRQRPDLFIAAHFAHLKSQMSTLPSESWSWRRHADFHAFSHRCFFKTQKRMPQPVLTGLDGGNVSQVYALWREEATRSGRFQFGSHELRNQNVHRQHHCQHRKHEGISIPEQPTKTTAWAQRFGLR